MDTVQSITLTREMLQGLDEVELQYYDLWILHQLSDGPDPGERVDYVWNWLVSKVNG